MSLAEASQSLNSRKGEAHFVHGTMHAETSDLELFFSLKEGNEEALGLLMERYRRLVFSVAQRKLRDEGEAEDVVQTVFLELYRLRDRFDPKLGTVRIWLLQLAYRRSFDRFQYLSRSRFFDAIDLDEVVDLHSSSPCLATRMDCRERVLVAAKSLNPTQRRVIELAHFEGYSLREIAEESGETLGSVRHHFYRGLRKMRHCLEVHA